MRILKTIASMAWVLIKMLYWDGCNKPYFYGD